MSDSDWKRLAKLIVDRRVEMGMRTTKALADRTGLTARALGDLENGRRTNFSRGTLRAVELTLGWKQGSIDEVLNGGEPEVAKSRAELVIDKVAPLDDIAELLDKLLRDSDRLVDETRAIDLDGPAAELAGEVYETVIKVCTHIFKGEENVYEAAVEMMSAVGTDERPRSLAHALSIVLQAQVALHGMWGGPMIQARQTIVPEVDRQVDDLQEGQNEYLRELESRQPDDAPPPDSEYGLAARETPDGYRKGHDKNDE